MAPLHLCTAHLCLFLDVGIFKTNPISSHFITSYMCFLSKIKLLKRDCSMNIGINEASFQMIYVHIFPPPPFVPHRTRVLCHSPVYPRQVIPAGFPGLSLWELPAQGCTLGSSREGKEAPIMQSRSGPLAKKWAVTTVQSNYRTHGTHT